MDEEQIEIIEGPAVQEARLLELVRRGDRAIAANARRRRPSRAEMQRQRDRVRDAQGFLTLSLARLGVFGLRRDQTQLVLPGIDETQQSRLGTIAHAPLGPLQVLDLETCSALMGLWRAGMDRGPERGLYFTNRRLADMMHMSWRAGRENTNELLDHSLQRLKRTTIVATLHGPDGVESLEREYNVLDSLTRARVKRLGETWEPRHASFNEVFFQHLTANWGVELDLAVCAALRRERSQLARRLFILLESHRLFPAPGRRERVYERRIDAELLTQLQVTDSNRRRAVRNMRTAGELIMRHCPRYVNVDVAPARGERTGRQNAYKLVVSREDSSLAERRNERAMRREALESPFIELQAGS